MEGVSLVKRRGRHQQSEHDGLPDTVDHALREPVTAPIHLLEKLHAAPPQRPPSRRRLLLVTGLGACATGYGGLTVLSVFVLGHAFVSGALSTAIVQTVLHLPDLNKMALAGGSVLAWGALGLAAAYATPFIHRPH